MLPGAGSASAAAIAVSTRPNIRGRGSIGTGRPRCSGRRNRLSRPDGSAPPNSATLSMSRTSVADQLRTSKSPRGRLASAIAPSWSSRAARACALKWGASPRRRGRCCGASVCTIPAARLTWMPEAVAASVPVRPVADEGGPPQAEPEHRAGAGTVLQQPERAGRPLPQVAQHRQAGRLWQAVRLGQAVPPARQAAQLLARAVHRRPPSTGPWVGSG